MNNDLPDDDLTQVRTSPVGRPGNTPHAAHPAASGSSAGPPAATPRGNALPVGYRMAEFQVEGVIGEGGFGIVYRAHDLQLARRVAIKEFMPAALAVRTDDFSIVVRAEHHRETFDAGLRSFINEARLLARFDHPALVKVYRFWEERGTALMVMPFYQGPTLKAWLRAQPAPPPEAWLLHMLWPLMDALQDLHEEGCFHRDIAPDNVLLLAPPRSVGPMRAGSDPMWLGRTQEARGRVDSMGDLRSDQRADLRSGASPLDHPLLLDFGAARQLIGDMTQALTVILKPGYAPVEQYAEIPSMQQGPWTDVYALAAVLYGAMFGRPPMPSVARLMRDDMVPATARGHGFYSPQFLAAIDAGLVVRPEDRPQSIAAFRDLLPQPDRKPAKQQRDMSRFEPALPGPPSLLSAPMPTPAHTIDPQTTMKHRPLTRPTRDPAPLPAVRSSPVPLPSSARVATGRRRSALAIGVLGVAALLAATLGGVAIWRFGSSLDATLSPSPNAAPSPALSPIPAPTGEATKDLLTQPELSPPSLSNPPTASATPSDWLAELHAVRDPNWNVQVTPSSTRLVIDRDRLRFSVQSSQTGYLYVFMADSTGTQLLMLLPGSATEDNRIAPGQTLMVPRGNLEFVVSGPPGRNRLLVMVSRQRRDFSRTGLRFLATGIGQFDIGQAGRAAAQRLDGKPGLAGITRCAKPGTACAGDFGAITFEVEEVKS